MAQTQIHSRRLCLTWLVCGQDDYGTASDFLPNMMHLAESNGMGQHLIWHDPQDMG